MHIRTLMPVLARTLIVNLLTPLSTVNELPELCAAHLSEKEINFCILLQVLLASKVGLERSMADLEAIKTQLEDVAKTVAAQTLSVTPSPPKPEVLTFKNTPYVVCR
jgi:hypothetical protein